MGARRLAVAEFHAPDRDDARQQLAHEISVSHLAHLGAQLVARRLGSSALRTPPSAAVLRSELLVVVRRLGLTLSC